MKAARINEWGQPYQIEDIPQPTPASDEVLIRVHAASVNPVDSMVAAGYLQSMVKAPMTAGTDFAGEVVSTGSDVSHVKAGDAVYGMISIRGGAFAEYATPKSHEVAPKPESLDFAQAAAVPLPAMAAWQAVDTAQIKPGERVLIHGAGGNVGSVAVQLVKNQGGYVIASDVGTKTDFLKGLGADEIAESDTQKFEDVAGKVDVVLNFAASDLELRSLDVLGSGGRYATTVQQNAKEEAEKRGIVSVSVFAQPSPDKLSHIAGLIDQGKVKVFVNRVFPLDEAQSALEYRQTGTATTTGKIVLNVG